LIDVLLILPPLRDMERSQVPPLGLGYIASVLKNEFTVKIIDMGAEKIGKSELINILKEECPKVIGISSIVTGHNSGLKIAKIAKEVLGQDVMIIMGGPQVTFLSEETLINNLSIDVVALGEGEYTVKELVSHKINGIPKCIDDIKGIVFLRDNQVIYTDKRGMIEDLDSVPFPSRELFRLELYQDKGTIITGRGCPFSCKFCASSSLCGRRYRARSSANVLKEIEEMYYKFNITKFYIADDTFTFNKKRVREICEGIIDRELNITWGCGTRVDCIDEESLDIMYKAGCRGILVGIESGSDEILTDIGKGINTNQIYDACRKVIKCGMSLGCSFIIGLPEDNWDTVLKSLELARRIQDIRQDINAPAVSLYYSIFTPLPGSYYYENKEKLGVELLNTDWDKFNFLEPVINTKNLTSSQLRELYFMVNAPRKKSE
jgi:radical SAM superfamily enzyme YgiQ (UPF0313 family)